MVPKNSQPHNKTFIDQLIVIAAVGTPIMTLPQVYAIWVQNNKGTSLITWSAYALLAVVWLIYGLKYKDKAIILMQSLCVVIYSAVVVGLIV